MNTVTKKIIIMICLSMTAVTASAQTTTEGTTQVGTASSDPFMPSTSNPKLLKAEKALELKKQQDIRMYKDLIRRPVLELLKRVSAIPSNEIRFASIMRDAPSNFARNYEGCVAYSGTISADALVKMAIDAKEMLGDYWLGNFLE